MPLVATAIELAYLANAVHENTTEDEAQVPFAGCKINWSNRFAVLTGAYLLARSCGLVARLDSQITQLVSRASAEVCDGRLRELAMRSGACSEDDYLDALARRHGTYYALPCLAAGLLSDIPPERLAALTGFGRNLSMALQLASEVEALRVDLENPLAHPLASLLANRGLPTHRLTMASGDGAKLCELMQCRNLFASDISEALTIVRKSGALSHVAQRACMFAIAADACLDELPDEHAKTGLCELADPVARGRCRH